jgi:hypothetical protein
MQRGGGRKGSRLGFRERAARREAVVGGRAWRWREGSWGGGVDRGLEGSWRKRQDDEEGFGYFVESPIEVSKFCT